MTGIELADGALVAADRVLSAADGRFTHSVLLGEAEGEMNARFDPERLSDQPVQVNLGVADDWSSITGPLTYLLPDAPSAAGRPQTRLTVHNKYFDPRAAPVGKSALTVFLDSDYSFWKELQPSAHVLGAAGDEEIRIPADPPPARSSRYGTEKKRCADMVIEIIGRHRPGFRDRVEVIDVSTPLTRERYTGNWRGAMQARRPDAGAVKALLQGSPRYDHRSLRGFYAAGQWVESWGGVTTASLSGRNAVRMMCRRDGVRFVT